MAKLNLFKIRISTAFKILFNSKLHWMFISLNNEQLVRHIQEQDLELNVMSHRLAPYNVKKILSCIEIDEVDLILDKAEWQANADEFLATKMKSK